MRCRGWCGKHYLRWQATGDPLRTPSGRVQNPGALCAVDECERPSRKRGWCEKHYSRWRKRGSVADEDQAWTLGERGDCIVCTRPVAEGSGFRRYCGRSCATLAKGRTTNGECAQCGALIDYTQRHPSGRLKHSDATLCGSCRGPSNLRRFVPLLVERDGTDCHLCGLPVDLSLRYPDPMSRSVDHVIPRAQGGPNALVNYALSHLLCNVRKNNRMT